MKRTDKTIIAAIALMLMACGESKVETTATVDSVAPVDSGAAGQIAVASNPLKNAYFGDTHIHTALSFDAYLFGTRRTPNDAYMFAKGNAIEHASGLQMQMRKPLDFLAVSDHAFFMGMMGELAQPDSAYKNHELAPAVKGATDAAGSGVAFQAVLGFMRSRDADNPNDLDPDKRVLRSAWQEVIDAAQRHYEPGKFTTFVGYEYTSSGPESQNLHRNVIFRDDNVPTAPYSRFDSLNPEDLWSWMDQQRAQGKESLAIPHNSNGSDGWMFATNKWSGDKVDAQWAEQRMRNEPLVENTQVKGTSDTHPLLSPNDEWANFEIMPLRIASTLTSQPNGSYVRDAYLNGLLLEQQIGVNPYQFGVIGASDTHNAAGSFEEDNYWSKTGFTDINPEARGSVPTADSTPEDPKYTDNPSQYWGASGLAGVWAESNTREAIFAAMQRKETFSTSGPHIKLRFFAGYDFGGDMVDAPDSIAKAYANGVPMGGELTSKEGTAPSFYIWASQDPDTQPLQRLQIIKGWVEGGKPREQVIDVACADGLAVDPNTMRCPDNGAKVDLSDCSVTPNKGDSELATVWSDPNYDAKQAAFYYVRVLENPTCRWSTYDAIRAGVPPRADMQAVIQDRAWSSPIWLAQ